MTATNLAPPPDLDTAFAPAVDIVVPVHNEERELAANIRRLHAYLRSGFPFTARITIADNASTDATLDVAHELAAQLPGLRVVRLDEKGRGRALRAAWSSSDAQVLAYMDCDLSTDLAALLPLVAPLLSGHSDVAIGSRLTRGARVVRGPKRELISRAYNLILHTVLSTRFTDAQCGFKAIRADRARELLPQVQDGAWFFDTELLVLAERQGLRIHEVPVDWVDDTDSRVHLVSTAVDDLRGVARMYRSQFVRFGAIGVVSTIAYLLLYVLLRQVTPAEMANAVALLVTAVANTAANRRLTFGVSGRESALRHHLQGLGVFGAALIVTTMSLAALHAVTHTPSRVAEVTVLILANLAATALRFVLLRGWVFRAASATNTGDTR
jgi:glycosyltransferase involved in cell wall biosynthesis